MKSSIIILLCCVSLHARHGSWQARAGYLRFSNALAQGIYSQGAPDFEVEGRVYLNSVCWLWHNLNASWQHGFSQGLGNSSHIAMGIYSLGPSIHFPCLRNVHCILGGGISGGYIHTIDITHYLPQKNSSWSIGAVFKTGFIIQKPQGSMEAFADYYYQPVYGTQSNNHFDMGGLRIGIGLGYIF